MHMVEFTCLEEECRSNPFMCYICKDYGRHVKHKVSNLASPWENSTYCICMLSYQVGGAQWLSGRVLDWRQKGRGLEPHRRHFIVSLSKSIKPSLVLVQPRKPRPFIAERLLMGRKESNQTKNSVGIYIFFFYLSHIVMTKKQFKKNESKNICLGCSKEPSQIIDPQHMFWLRNKKINF